MKERFARNPQRVIDELYIHCDLPSNRTPWPEIARSSTHPSHVENWRTKGSVMNFAETVTHWFTWGFFLSEWAIRLVMLVVVPFRRTPARALVFSDNGASLRFWLFAWSRLGRLGWLTGPRSARRFTAT
jgi:hypothetical protein